MIAKKLFIVKKLNKHGKWDSVRFYDENNSFRGAEDYIKIYKDKINKHLNAAEGKSKTRLKLQLFELDNKEVKLCNSRILCYYTILRYGTINLP
jgi:hypothetical protein